MYILSCLVIHNFLKDLGYVVDEDRAHCFQDRAYGEDVADQASEGGHVEGDGKAYRDHLYRLWIGGADE